jgi:hypothetical protein
VDRFHHLFEDGIEQLARLLRIAVRQKFHRALEIGEQNRDLLTLALKGDLGGEDLLGEMLRGICVWRGEARREGTVNQVMGDGMSAGELLDALLGARSMPRGGCCFGNRECNLSS